MPLTQHIKPVLKSLLSSYLASGMSPDDAQTFVLSNLKKSSNYSTTFLLDILREKVWDYFKKNVPEDYEVKESKETVDEIYNMFLEELIKDDALLVDILPSTVMPVIDKLTKGK